MSCRFRLPSCLLAALACAPAFAASDDSASAVAVPLVTAGADRSTTVTIANHGPVDVELVAFVVEGNATGVSPQLKCVDAAGNAWVVPALGGVVIDIDRSCGLGSRPFAGAFHAAAASSGVHHLSAAATLHLLDRSGQPAHSVALDGLPLAAFAGTQAQVEAQGLRNDPGIPARSACQVATASARGTAFAEGELVLLDGAGGVLGRRMRIKVAGQQVQRFDDVFAAAGLATQSVADARAVFRPSASNEVSVVLNCDREAVSASSGVTSVTQLIGTPAVGASSTRQHLVSAKGARGSFRQQVTGPQNDVFVVWVRQQDRFRCSASSPDPLLNANLMVTLVDPGKSASFTNRTSSSPVIDSGTKANRNRGVSDAWAVLVEQINPNSALTIPYEVTCRSGNGTSTPVLMFSSDKFLPRPPA